MLSLCRLLAFLTICISIISCEQKQESHIDYPYFNNSNAAVIIIKGKTDTAITINCSTRDYFEGASLSKTVFNIFTSTEITSFDKEHKDSFYAMINHSAGIENKAYQECEFFYSDSSYMAAMSLFDRINDRTFAELIQDKYLFVHKPGINILKGYITGDEFAREARISHEVKPNGSLLINEISGEKLLDDFRRYVNSFAILDSAVAKVCDYDKLFWVNGVGMDISTGNPLFFQWGSNWCYNHLLLYDKKQDKSLLLLTNSVIGAHEIAEFIYNEYHQTRPAFLDYINFW